MKSLQSEKQALEMQTAVAEQKAQTQARTRGGSIRGGAPARVTFPPSSPLLLATLHEICTRYTLALLATPPPIPPPTPPPALPRRLRRPSAR